MKYVIFGAGELGVQYFLRNRQNQIIAFVDNNKELHGKRIYDTPILSPQKLLELEFDRIYISSENYWEEIFNEIVGMGISQEKISLDILDKKNKDKDEEHVREVLLELYTYIDLYDREKYEREWQKIKGKYKEIRILKLTVAAVGELIPRFTAIYHTGKFEQSVLNVFLPSAKIDKSVYRICNRELIKLIQKFIYIPKTKEIPFWIYVYKNHTDELDVQYLNKYSIRHLYPNYETQAYHHPFQYTEQQKRLAGSCMNKMSLDRPFVCFCARTSDYNKQTIGFEYSFYDYRNMDFRDYQNSIDYLSKQQISCVRMGRGMGSMSSMNNCIDYAGLYSSDFMDLYLVSKCKFMVASSGIASLAHLFSTPLLAVNVVPISFGWGGMQYTKMDMYIPKKYYDENKKRYLSLREIMDIDEECLIFSDKFREKGIQFINNTPEEIQTAVEEFLDRLEGRWEDTEEDIKNYRKYMEIHDEVVERVKKSKVIWTGVPTPSRLAASYLRENQYLLE